MLKMQAVKSLQKGHRDVITADGAYVVHGNTRRSLTQPYGKNLSGSTYMASLMAAARHLMYKWQ